MANKKQSTQWQAFTSTLSTTLVLIMLGLTVLTMLTANRLSDDVKGNLSITLRMNDSISEPEIKAFEKQLQKKPYVAQTDYISREDVLKEQVESMGSDPTDFLHANPFQAEIEVGMAPEYANVDSMDWVTEQLEANPKVSEVIYQNDLVDSLNTNLQRVSLVFLVIAVSLLIISAALINSTVRLSVYSRRFLIHTMNLVGASWSFIRRPFMLRSLWIGLIAAILADAILVGLVQLLYGYDETLRHYITLTNLGIMSGCVLVCGLALTLLCTYFSVSHFLRIREEKMYK